MLISHIRHATQGGIALANTQPFQREFGGRTHIFAHNGRLDGIERRYAGAGRRFRPLGQTDSEVAFCLLLEQLAPLWQDGSMAALDERLGIVARFAAAMRQWGPANFLYADGDTLFAHGDRRMQAHGCIAAPGLWRLTRRCAIDADALASNGGRGQELTLVASVPLTGEAWQPFGEGEVVALRDGIIAGTGALAGSEGNTGFRSMMGVASRASSG